MAECRGHQLPKYDMATARLFEAPASCESRAERWRLQHRALAHAYGADALAEMVGGSKVEDVDLQELEALFDETATAYGAVGRESRARSVAEVMQVLDSIPVDRLQAIADAMGKVYEVDQRARGFKRVV